MKKIFRLFVFLLFSSSILKAQKVYFIYLQTDNQQPFYARLGEKIYNSTPSGYLILSNLRDSNYSVNIGIQESQTRDQAYAITVNRKDQGFLIKDFGEKGWGLFNLNTMAIIMPATNSIGAVQTVKTEKREDNAFTNLLAKVADDSTIKEKPIIEKPVEKKTDATILATDKKEEPKNETKEIIPSKEEIKKEITIIDKKEEPKVDTSAHTEQIKENRNTAERKADSISAAKATEAELSKQENLRRQDSLEKLGMETIANTVEYKKSIVRLKSESSTTAGIGLVFVDMLSDNIVDTVRILIPADNKIITSPESNQEEKKFLDIPSVDSVQKVVAKPLVTKSNNCKTVATENDFFKLRKRMVGERNDDNMIGEAKKIFKMKCFSTVQIRHLSTLFLTDEFKYKFFDAASQYISDSENFPTLQAELKNEHFINRFKAMLRQ